MALLQISEPGMAAEPHQRRLAAGIDLGTTHSLVATVRSGQAQTLADSQGQRRACCPATCFKNQNLALPRKLAQRVLNETLWNPAFFCCCKIEASQGWDGHVSAASMFATKCRRLGGALAAGFQPA